MPLVTLEQINEVGQCLTSDAEARGVNLARKRDLEALHRDVTFVVGRLNDALMNWADAPGRRVACRRRVAAPLAKLMTSIVGVSASEVACAQGTRTADGRAAECEILLGDFVSPAQRAEAEASMVPDYYTNRIAKLEGERTRIAGDTQRLRLSIAKLRARDAELRQDIERYTEHVTKKARI